MEAVCVGGSQLETVRTVSAWAWEVQATMAKTEADKSNFFMKMLQSKKRDADMLRN
jgi:hypothetical protein